VKRRSEITVDLAALRRNVERMCEAAAPAELWAVVKADAYGHGMQDAARASLHAGAAALCVITPQEGEALR
jgi:alanine racemase